MKPVGKPNAAIVRQTAQSLPSAGDGTGRRRRAYIRRLRIYIVRALRVRIIRGLGRLKLPSLMVLAWQQVINRRTKIPYDFQPLSTFPATLEDSFPRIKFCGNTIIRVQADILKLPGVIGRRLSRAAHSRCTDEASEEVGNTALY
jgi:hypothetical protein